MSKNHMAEVAKIFGVKLGESFKITSDTRGDYHNYYRFTENNCLEISDDDVEWKTTIAAVLLKHILMGDIRIVKLPWRPQKCAPYYIPCIVAQSEHMYSMFYWNDDNYDKEYYRMGLVCKTPEEAVALTKKIVAMVQEEKKNGQLHD